MAQRTVRCTPDMSGAPATSPVPLESDRWSSDFWARLGVRCTPDMYCSMSGAQVWACLTSARAARALNASQVAVGAEIVVAPRLHRTVRCTPDMSGVHRTCPVNYSGAAVMISRGCQVPEPRRFEAPDTVRCTPDSPVNYSAPAPIKYRG
jgi:hypothetical protein